MIPFILYSLALLLLIHFNGFFGLFKDRYISKKQFSFLFLGKIMAVPVFYLLYQRFYGGIEKFDSGKFFNDVIVITDCAKSDPLLYLRLLFGLQNDSPGSYDHVHCLINTVNWDNGVVKDYLYNDNRVVIRIHTLFNFIAFDSFLVHSLFNCFLSFIGITFLYKSIKEFFVGKEVWVLLILCFFPALWFYTGALLKDGICLFVMGCTIYRFKKLITGNYNVRSFIFLLVLLFLSGLLKPYLLLFSAATFGLFFLIYFSAKIKHKVLVFFTVISGIVLLANGISVLMKNRSLVSAALEQQKRFEAVSKGGIFLTDSANYMQLKPDTALIKRTEQKNMFSIRKGVSYMYWEPGRPADTLYHHSNTDTSTRYRLIYLIPESGSNIQLNKKNGLSLLFSAFYYSLFHPLFLNAESLLQLLASFENLGILLALFIVILGLLRSKKDKFPVLVFLLFALALCLLIGITAPNSGAIFRYRAPGVVFILLAALYYIEPFRHKNNKNNSIEAKNEIP